ncbi:MAG: hypothetical protein AABW85_00810 [archaeon]
MKKDFIFLAIAMVSISLFIYTNLSLFYSGQKNLANLEAVKSQVSNAKSALVNYPVPDYQLAIIVSIASSAAGIALGFFSAGYLREEK